MKTLVDHLEHHLGKIQRGWSSDINGSPLPFQVVECQGGSLSGVSTYSTLGLSQAILLAPRSEKLVRLELVLPVSGHTQSDNPQGLVQHIASLALSEMRSLVRGETFGPIGQLFHGSSLVSVYIAPPTCFADTFREYTGDEEKDPIVFAWILPITRSEHSYVKSWGWESFEDSLSNAEIDLANVHRNSVV